MIGEVLGKLGFDWKVALANLVNFLIIYYLLRNVVFKKLGHAIKERQEKIQKGLDDAKKAETALVMAESEKDGILREAQKQSKKITEEADKKAKIIISDSKKEGNLEAEKIKGDALKDIEKVRLETEKKLQKDFVNMVLDGVEKVSVNQMDKNKSQAFAEGLLK
jgi:F-type H+-transporting ATPase subunit b